MGITKGSGYVHLFIAIAAVFLALNNVKVFEKGQQVAQHALEITTPMIKSLRGRLPLGLQEGWKMMERFESKDKNVGKDGGNDGDKCSCEVREKVVVERVIWCHVVLFVYYMNVLRIALCCIA